MPKPLPAVPNAVPTIGTKAEESLAGAATGLGGGLPVVGWEEG